MKKQIHLCRLYFVKIIPDHLYDFKVLNLINITIIVKLIIAISACLRKKKSNGFVQ